MAQLLKKRGAKFYKLKKLVYFCALFHRSRVYYCCCSSVVEHFLGKEEVVSSSLINSSAYNRANKCHRKVAFVVYIAVQTRLLTAIYTIKYNLVACRLVYDLAPSVLNKRSAVKPTSYSRANSFADGYIYNKAQRSCLLARL